jgi:proline dehydrogenase
MIRHALADLARNESLGGLLARTPVTREVVARLVAGEGLAEAIGTAARLADEGMRTALERTSSPTPDDDEAAETAAAYLDLVGQVAADGLTASAEVVILPEAVGVGPSQSSARRLLAEVAGRAGEQGVDLWLGHGPNTDVEASLALAEESWDAGVRIGVTLPAARRRTESDCARLSGRPVRIVKGTVAGPRSESFQQAAEIDKAFVRCARRLLGGTGFASFATHDPRLVEIVQALAARAGRTAGTYELVFFMGRQEGLQQSLAASGEQVRVYVPYGSRWFERLVAGLAEQPNSLASAVRSLLPGVR